MKLTRDQVREWYGKDIETRLKETFFLVEADSFAVQSLWEKHVDKEGNYEWEQSGGFAVTVGVLVDMPVAISITWARIDCRWVAFWYPCSQVVDHRMIDKWLEDNFKGTWDGENRRATCDAMNFHHFERALVEDIVGKRLQSNVG